MNTLRYHLTCILCLLALHAHGDDIWGTDGDFLEDDSNAKVQRHVAKQRAREANMTAEEREAASQDNGACGSLDVGNVKGDGRGDVDNVVIIKGDVINANNRCR